MRRNIKQQYEIQVMKIHNNNTGETEKRNYKVLCDIKRQKKKKMK